MLGVLLVMKSLEDEWYVVIKPSKLTYFEIERFFCIVIAMLHVCAIPTLESTDSIKTSYIPSLISSCNSCHICVVMEYLIFE